jgi:hypothetical protein
MGNQHTYIPAGVVNTRAKHSSGYKPTPCPHWQPPHHVHQGHAIALPAPVFEAGNPAYHYSFEPVLQQGQVLFLSHLLLAIEIQPGLTPADVQIC